MIYRIATILVFICLIAVPTQAWRGKNDNKPLAELEQMTESNLAIEALAACLRSTSTTPVAESAISIQEEALQYITMISRYGRQQNRGTTPWWAIAMYEAAWARDSARCKVIVEQVVESAGTEQAKHEAQKRQRNAWVRTDGPG